MDDSAPFIINKRLHYPVITPEKIAITRAVVEGNSYVNVGLTHGLSKNKVKVIFDDVVAYVNRTTLASFDIGKTIAEIRCYDGAWLKALDITLDGLEWWTGADEFALTHGSEVTFSNGEITQLWGWIESVLAKTAEVKQANRKRRTARNILIFKEIVSGMRLTDVQTKHDMSKHVINGIFNAVRKKVEREPSLSNILIETSRYIYVPRDGSTYNTHWMRQYATMWLKAANDWLTNHPEG